MKQDTTIDRSAGKAAPGRRSEEEQRRDREAAGTAGEGDIEAEEIDELEDEDDLGEDEVEEDEV